MQYAKIKENNLVVFPYTWITLQEENPNSYYDSRFNLTEWYSKTEDAVNTDSYLVEVTIAIPPTVDTMTQSVELKSSPELSNEMWTLNWNIRDKTEEEKLYLTTTLTTSLPTN